MTVQLELASEPRFEGRTYDPALDSDRLSTLLRRVYWALRTTDRWLTIRELCEAVGGSETGVSAKLRDLRKAKWGGHVIGSRRRTGQPGCWEYRLMDPIGQGK